MKTKGLTVEVFRCYSGDCSNGGLSSKFDELLLIDASGPSEGTEENSIKIVRRIIAGREFLHVEPIKEKPSGLNGPMFGGCFVYTSDSRFREFSDYPLALHDRFEVPTRY